jgi:membrane-associated PAP2 superfamily phosphatase
LDLWHWGLGYGTLMSTARLLQGAHYVSDAFWSLGVMGALRLSAFTFSSFNLHYLIAFLFEKLAIELNGAYE